MSSVLKSPPRLDTGAELDLLIFKSLPLGFLSFSYYRNEEFLLTNPQETVDGWNGTFLPLKFLSTKYIQITRSKVLKRGISLVACKEVTTRSLSNPEKDFFS
jgi:hypothetical protein